MTAVPQQAPPSGYPADWLTELARRHRESNKLFFWTLLIGLFCLWPVWIVSYLEYAKMRTIREQVFGAGVNVDWWMTTYNAKGGMPI